MSITVVVQMTVKPGMEEAHEARLKVALPETRNAEGCLELIAHRDLDQPNRFMVVERWTTREAYQAYVDWRTEIGSLKAMAERLAAPLEFRFLEVVATTAAAS